VYTAFEALRGFGSQQIAAIVGWLAKAEDAEFADMPGSTLSHHLSRMSKVGLMQHTRDGSTLSGSAENPLLQLGDG